MKALSLFTLLLFSSIICSAQITGTEQDCIGAIPLCDPVYVVDTSYQGLGEVEDINNGMSCLQNEENNSVWFTFEIADSGVLEFVIDAMGGQNDTVDYDFSLFDVTGKTCADIYNGGLEVRCNYSFTNNMTGLRTGDTAFVASSADRLPFLAPVSVTSGQKFALLIDNFSSTTFGFTLDFSASTTSFITPASPNLTVSNFETINDSIILVETSYGILCSSIASNGSDFSITGPTTITITGATGLGCNPATLTSTITLDYTGHLIDGGTYALTPQTGTDGNGLLTLCAEVPQTGTSFIATDTVIFTSAAVAQEMKIQLFPNPTTGNLIIKMNASFMASSRVEVFDVFGKRVHVEAIPQTGGQLELQLNHLAGGVYILKLTRGNFSASQKFTLLK